MTRPKVPPEQRQRTAQACEVCKRRKQKCNGLLPCNTCERRKFTCSYSDRDDESPTAAPAAKKVQTEPGLAKGSRRTNGASESLRAVPDSQNSPNLQTVLSEPSPDHLRRDSIAQANQIQTPYPTSSSLDPRLESDVTASEAAAKSLQSFSARIDDFPRLRGASSTDSHEEEAVIYSQARMLQDPTGRLLYIGDSATLSFLQLLRMMVENVVGPSAFTVDPRRHKITETPFSLPPNSRHTHLLPDKRAAYILVDSYFVNTHGFLQIFDRSAFTASLERCYSDPLITEPSWLCLLNMVFAIGLMLATPRRGTADFAIIEKLHKEHADLSEVFYLNAKSLNDPLYGFEDADFWSVQALALMSFYMLVKSRRNTAFALLGMAVRSAYALGLHREETMVIFGYEEQTARRNLWRSLFVLDRFLSLGLGRPTAISEDDCSGDTLKPSQPDDPDAFGFDSALGTSISHGKTNGTALEAAVRSCSVIGRILKEVYQKRRISTRLAQEIADVCKQWPRALSPQLHWRQAATATPLQGIAILHVNLLYCHSIIVLTRPFFLYIMNSEVQRNGTLSTQPLPSRQRYTRMEKFSEACVIASTHTIILVQNAYEAGYLPRRNPAVIYFLLPAALILLANEFASLYTNGATDQCVANAINVLSYCAEGDVQAARHIEIIKAFRDVIVRQRDRRAQQLGGASTAAAASAAVDQSAAYNAIGTTATPAVGADAPSSYHQPTASASSATADKQTAKPNSHPTPTTTATTASSAAAPPAAEPAADTATSAAPEPAAAAALPLSSAAALPPNLLDLSAFDTVGLGLAGSGGSGSLLSPEDSGSQGDEHFDFDALWAWPGTGGNGNGGRTGGVGVASSGEMGGLGGEMSGMGVAGEDLVNFVSESAVPLFGVYDE
ncbi:fungal-specific transcription factor domain-containing protein [Phyllosticta citribraziliensis]|uniref:Fungal-specific transcription factor domain-containing protein n=1 Tax=Phyllosticta citribraziliensis TaxID=989973 RepID=A0ABR1L8I4_9PEZI